MNRIPHINSRAEDVQEIAEAINAIANLVNDDLVRKASESMEPFLTPIELGGLMLAVEHLSRRSEHLGEALWEVEERLAVAMREAEAGAEGVS